MVGIKESLRQKLYANQVHYEIEEILWLLDHIGDSSAAIRDELVFNSLAGGIQLGFFSNQQFQLIAEQAVKRQGLLYRQDEIGLATLNRSFTALLYANLLSADGNPDSIYFGNLTEIERGFLLEQGRAYLLNEKDYTGYSEEYGWVHAFAHGADLLAEIVCHPSFSVERVPEALQVLEHVFKTVPVRFVNDEDWRLARVLYQAVLSQKISQEKLVDWLTSQDFPLESNQDFISFSNFRSCLLEVYVQLDSQKQLSDSLRAAIQDVRY